jgi:hypothetical protein
MANFLTREQIEQIVDSMTARDLFNAFPDQATPDLRGADTAGKAFEAAAERQGHGAGALDRVKPADAVLLANRLSEVFDVGGPKAKGGASSPRSAGTGGSARKRS